MSSSKPSSRQQTKRKTKDQIKKEEEEQLLLQLERERLEEEARKPKQFTDYEFVEKVMQVDVNTNATDLTAMLAQDLKLHDYLVNLRSSILIDFHVYNIEYVVDTYTPSCMRATFDLT